MTRAMTRPVPMIRLCPDHLSDPDYNWLLQVIRIRIASAQIHNFGVVLIAKRGSDTLMR